MGNKCYFKSQCVTATACGGDMCTVVAPAQCTPVAPTPTPSPFDCPGGSLSACKDICRQETTVHDACVDVCLERCCSPTPPPAPPSPRPTPRPPAPAGVGFFKLTGWPSPPPGPLPNDGRQISVDCLEHTTVRLDPIFKEGQCHDHIHSVFGADRFGSKLTVEDMTYSPDEVAKTSCTNPIDGSIYWTPSLYKRDNGKLRKVRTTLTVYYKDNDGHSGADNQPLRPLPPGLKLLRGNPMRNQPFTATNDMDGEHMYWCEHGVIAHPTPDGGFPTDMSTKWQFNINYPSCWDETELDCIDRMTGEMPCMAFAVNNMCPDTHPYRIPRIVAEIHYWVSDNGFYGSREDYILSTSDTRGYAAHLDIVAGWQPDLLHAAISSGKCFKNGWDDTSCPFHQFNGLNTAPCNSPFFRPPFSSYRSQPPYSLAEPVDNIPGMMPPSSGCTLPIPTSTEYNWNNNDFFYRHSGCNGAITNTTTVI